MSSRRHRALGMTLSAAKTKAAKTGGNGDTTTLSMLLKRGTYRNNRDHAMHGITYMSAAEGRNTSSVERAVGFRGKWRELASCRCDDPTSKSSTPKTTKASQTSKHPATFSEKLRCAPPSCCPCPAPRQNVAVSAAGRKIEHQVSYAYIHVL